MADQQSHRKNKEESFLVNTITQYLPATTPIRINRAKRLALFTELESHNACR